MHRFLSEESYWCPGVSRDVVDRSIDNSLCFAAYEDDGRQIGFARVVTDAATFVYLGDVFVLPAHRGAGVGQRLMEAVMAHPDIQGVRRFMLATDDAHALYERFGFRALRRPGIFMEL